MRNIITDVEGTTSSLSFVKEVLFPFAAAALPAFVREHAERPDVRRCLEDAASTAGLSSGDQEAVIGQLLAWIAEDVKVTALKSLQGLIWESGYREGAYRAHLYEDAAECLRRWHGEGRKLYVYSSGSVQAQELFFRHSIYGDLSGLFSGHFDTRVGAKGEAESYTQICRQAGLTPGESLFLSDVEAELDAAREIGLATVRLCRREDYDKGPAEVTSAHPVVDGFDAIPEHLLGS
ncbi:MAG: acireductone synthase [Pseudomonadota bacterium]